MNDEIINSAGAKILMWLILTGALSKKKLLYTGGLLYEGMDISVGKA